MWKFRLLKSDLRGVEHQLKRLNTLLEAYLTASGVEIPQNGSKTPPKGVRESIEVSYTDPEAQFLQELLELSGRKPLQEEEISEKE